VFHEYETELGAEPGGIDWQSAAKTRTAWAAASDPDVDFAELTARYQADSRLTVPATVYNGVLNRVDEV